MFRGQLMAGGYRQINVDGGLYSPHRLAILYTKGRILRQAGCHDDRFEPYVPFNIAAGYRVPQGGSLVVDAIRDFEQDKTNKVGM
jgi:hypothetical protein